MFKVRWGYRRTSQNKTKQYTPLWWCTTLIPAPSGGRGRQIWAGGQPGLYSEFQACQDYSEMLSPKQTTESLPLPSSPQNKTILTPSASVPLYFLHSDCHYTQGHQLVHTKLPGLTPHRMSSEPPVSLEQCITQQMFSQCSPHGNFPIFIR